VLISAATGKVDRTFADLSVTDAVADGHGGWFVVTGKNLARLNPDGMVNTSWHSSLRSANVVTLIARSGNKLYTYSRNGIRAVDARTGAVLWTQVAAAPGGEIPVLSLAATRSVLYVAGQFTSIGGMARRGLAALAAGSGKVLGFLGPSTVRYGDGPGYFDAVAVVGQRLFVGGVCISLDGRPRPGLAVLTRANGGLTSWRPGTVRGLVPGAGTGDVEKVFVSRGVVLTAGHDGFGVLSAANGRVLPWMYRLDGVASSFDSRGTVVYLGGDIRNSFRAVDGHDRNNLAAFNLRTGKFTRWSPKLPRYVGVGKLVVSGGQILAAGIFANSLG